MDKAKSALLDSEARKENTDKIKDQARQSIKERLAQAKIEADRANRERREREKNTEKAQKKNLEI